MTPNEYQKLALTTLVTRTYLDTLTMCGLGLAGETGEVVEVLKKFMFHAKGEKPLDIPKIKDELSDLLWYIAVMADTLDLDLEDIMQHNIAKLQARHSGGQQTANGGTFNPHYTSDSVK